MKSRIERSWSSCSKRSWFWLLILGVIFTRTIPAQDKPLTDPAAGAATGSGRVLEFQTGTPGQSMDVPVPSAIRPTRGEQQPVSAEIRAQLQKFESARDAYLKRQKELTQQFKGAGEDQRRVVRDQIKVLREQWLEQSVQFRREARGRIADLKTELPQFEALKAGKSALDNKPDRRLK